MIYMYEDPLYDEVVQFRGLRRECCASRKKEENTVTVTVTVKGEWLR